MSTVQVVINFRTGGTETIDLPGDDDVVIDRERPEWVFVMDGHTKLRYAFPTDAVQSVEVRRV